MKHCFLGPLPALMFSKETFQLFEASVLLAAKRINFLFLGVKQSENVAQRNALLDDHFFFNLLVNRIKILFEWKAGNEDEPKKKNKFGCRMTYSVATEINIE